MSKSRVCKTFLICTPPKLTNISFRPQASSFILLSQEYLGVPVKCSLLRRDLNPSTAAVDEIQLQHRHSRGSGNDEIGALYTAI